MSSIAIRRAAPANPVSAAVNTAQVFAFASNAQAPATVAAPGKLSIEQKRFSVRAEGNVNVAGAFTVKATLLAALVTPGSPLVAANWTTLCAGTAQAMAAAGIVPWWIEARLIFDSQGGLMHGVFEQMVNNLFNAPAAITGVVSGINSTNTPVNQAGTVVAPSDPAVVFAVALTFGTAGANVGNLANFEVGF